MRRAAAWTVGLFGAGMVVSRLLPAAAWSEPAILVALGAAFLAVSARTGARPRSRALAPKQAAA